MVLTGYKGITLPEDLVEEVDRAVATGRGGYSSRAEFVKAAVRALLASTGDMKPLSREELGRALRAVAMTQPKNVDALIEGLLRELDLDDEPAPAAAPRERRIQPRP